MVKHGRLREAPNMQPPTMTRKRSIRTTPLSVLPGSGLSPAVSVGTMEPLPVETTESDFLPCEP